jgi:hypothetical protein
MRYNAVILAQARIHLDLKSKMDSGLRRNDGLGFRLRPWRQSFALPSSPFVSFVVNAFKG